jgi:hypothetical protein
MKQALAVLMAIFSYGCGEAADQRTQHPEGFSLVHPAGWTVDHQEGMARAYPPDTSELVAIGPVFPQRGQTAKMLLESLIAGRRVGPLRSPQLVSLQGDSNSAIALLTVSDKKAQAMVALRGGVGTLYIFGAKADRFAVRRPALVKILQSFRLEGAPSSPQKQTAPALNFQRLREPRENAFSLEFPAGWRTELGVYREGATSPRFESSAVAPDGKATIFLGERNAGSFTVPTAELAQFGMREGMVYNPTGVNPMPILRYLPGENFARYWLGMRLGGAEATGARSLPQVAQQLAQSRYQFGNPLGGQVHAGELTFTYQGQQGKVVAATEVYGATMGVQQWTLIYFAGFFADPARASEAEAALAHAIGSTQLNLEWLRMDRAFAKLDHSRVMAAMQYTNDLFRATMAERSESNARNARATGDLLAGTFRVLDPATNEYTTVQAGSNFYYRVNNTNTVIGSNQQLDPVDLTQMLRVDWDTRP